MPLLESTLRGRSKRGLLLPVQVRFSDDWIAICGDPMSATTTGSRVPFVRWPKRWAGLGAVEGDDGVGAERFEAGLFAAVRVPAGGEVDGDDGQGGSAKGVADGRCNGSQRWFEPGAGDGVDDDLGAVEQGPSGGFGFRRRELEDRNDRAVKPRQGICGSALELAFWTGESDGNTHFVAKQGACGDQTVAAVITRAAQDEDVPSTWVVSTDELGDSSSGIVHQFGEWYARHVGSPLIGSGHFGGGEHLHGGLDAGGSVVGAEPYVSEARHGQPVLCPDEPMP